MTILDRFWAWAAAHETLLWWTGLASLAGLVLGAALLPLVVVRLPRDYLLAGGGAHRPRLAARSVAGRLLAVGRNLLGGLLVAVGIAMLITPGQGLVTIVVGLGLMDLPRKHLLIQRLMGAPPVLHTINRIRTRAGRPPLHPPASE